VRGKIRKAPNAAAPVRALVRKQHDLKQYGLYGNVQRENSGCTLPPAQ
jgi:hypothetical protein